MFRLFRSVLWARSDWNYPDPEVRIVKPNTNQIQSYQVVVIFTRVLNKIFETKDAE